MTEAEAYLLAAWKRGAPGADLSRGFPRGFWPDVARVAVEMALAGSTSIEPSIRQTASSSASGLSEPAGGANKKARTADLLAELLGGV